MKLIATMIVLMIMIACFSGCGETFHGIGDDTSRIWRGAKTIVGVEK